MKSKYDVLIVGAGLYGSVVAYELSRAGLKCLVVERRNHIGGNCYTEVRDNINLHVYGPHIFHTSNPLIWDWINRFASFNQYRHRVKVNHKGIIYSFPPNLETFHRLWGTITPSEARQYLDGVRISIREPRTFEQWIISQVGWQVYELFFYGYTKKQWHRDPAALPAAIAKRIPIRLTYNDLYFDDCYQGIPVGGYTPIFEKMLSATDIELNIDYCEHKQELDERAEIIVYTGPIDRFFGYRFGRLEYLSVRIEHEKLELSDYQGTALMNFTAVDVPYTRIVEHKHFECGRQPKPITWISREYPVISNSGEEMYPVRDENNMYILKQYQAIAAKPQYHRFHFGGRLAEYQYYDMHQIIAAALSRVSDIAKLYK